ncbi:hypothetical protein J6590_007930 [Homalodisca vitripennis]|nr:hypothetical protein J6590_007930 [Homalodisca vitripennis]
MLDVSVAGAASLPKARGLDGGDWKRLESSRRCGCGLYETDDINTRTSEKCHRVRYHKTAHSSNI